MGSFPSGLSGQFRAPSRDTTALKRIMQLFYKFSTTFLHGQKRRGYWRETRLCQLRTQTKNPIRKDGNLWSWQVDGNSRRSKSRTRVMGVNPTERLPVDMLPMSLGQTNFVSRVSAKLPYLIDSVLRRQERKKIIIFYEVEKRCVVSGKHARHAKSTTPDLRQDFDKRAKSTIRQYVPSQPSFFFDMREASRIYFNNPVIYPQVEAQAIG